MSLYSSDKDVAAMFCSHLRTEWARADISRYVRILLVSGTQVSFPLQKHMFAYLKMAPVSYVITKLQFDCKLAVTNEEKTC